jgi:Fe-S cluster assembly ATP-binding protein
MLEIKDLHVTVDGKEIVKGISFNVNPGEIVALMGPNGCGKSTLSYALMGHPKYKVSGTIILDGTDISSLGPNERSKLGLFLSFQYPNEITGVTVTNFIKTALNARSKINLLEYQKKLKSKMSELGIDPSFSKRYLNEGFSGGEKKRVEMLQMMMLDPKYAVLDETDSGLDVTALKTVGMAIDSMKSCGMLVITHYRRILDYVNPSKVIIMKDGLIVKTGDSSLVSEIESRGYDWL